MCLLTISSTGFTSEILENDFGGVGACSCSLNTCSPSFNSNYNKMYTVSHCDDTRSTLIKPTTLRPFPVANFCLNIEILLVRCLSRKCKGYRYDKIKFSYAHTPKVSDTKSWGIHLSVDHNFLVWARIFKRKGIVILSNGGWGLNIMSHKYFLVSTNL